MWYDDITTEAKDNVGNWEKFEAFRGPYYRGRDVLEKLDRERHVVIFFETFSHPNGYEKGLIDAELITAMNRSDLEDLQNLINDALRLKTVG